MCYTNNMNGTLAEEGIGYMKICKKCGTENHSDEIFCTKCGENLMRSDYLESDASEDNSYEAPAKEINEEKTVEEAGEKDALSVEDNSSKEKSEKKKRSKKPLIITLIIIGVLLIAGAATAFCYLKFFHTPDKPTNGQLLSALNEDKTITVAKVGGKNYDFKVTKLERSKEKLTTDYYKCDVTLTRECDVYGISPVVYKVNYKKSGAKFKYDGASPVTDKVEFYAVSGVEEETATDKIHKFYKDAKFKQRDTKLDKGVDRLYYIVDNKEYDGIVTIRYDFSKTKGWVYKRFSDKKLEFKKGVTHKENGLLTNSSVKNILFLGVDSDTGVGRSDCMMLISVDANTGTIKQTSFARDNWFNIPGYGQNKLNAAFAFGGPELTVKTIAETFGVKIDNYVCVSFTTFKDVINNLGGVDVNITSDEAGYINWQINKNGQAGQVGLVKTSGGVTHLNGQQALWLCRDRGGNGFGGNDFTRSARQRRVIRSLVGTYKNYTPSKVLSTINILKKSVKTDLTAADFKWYAVHSPKFFGFKFKERSVPGDGEWQSGTSSGGAWIIQLNDFNKLKSDVQHFIYQDLK